MTGRLRFHFSLSCIGEGNGNPLQCSCLENPRDQGAWWAAIYRVAQSRTRLKWLRSSWAELACRMWYRSGCKMLVAVMNCISSVNWKNFLLAYITIWFGSTGGLRKYSFFVYIYFIYLFLYFLAVLGLSFCAGFFSGFGKQGLLSSCGVRASHCCGLCCWKLKLRGLHAP